MSSLVVHLKLKCLLKKQTHDDIIEAKEVYIQQAFGRYKGKLVLPNYSPSVYKSGASVHFTNFNINNHIRLDCEFHPSPVPYFCDD